MAGLVPAIHVFLAGGTKDVDARLKAGHDELRVWSYAVAATGRKFAKSQPRPGAASSKVRV